MTTVTATPRPRWKRVRRFLKHHALTGYAILAFGYLLLPIAVVILFSFNKPAGRFNYVWQELHLRQLAQLERRARPRRRDGHVARDRGCSRASSRLLLGTLIALALVRHHFRGRGATNLLVFLPMATPEIVLGAVAADALPQHDRGHPTRLPDDLHRARHVRASASSVVTVKARLIGFDRHLEEAAMDLGADELTTFRQGDAAAARARDPRGGAARVRALARRLRDHLLQLGRRDHVPRLRLGDGARRRCRPRSTSSATAIFLVAIGDRPRQRLRQTRRRRKGAA